MAAVLLAAVSVAMSALQVVAVDIPVLLAVALVLVRAVSAAVAWQAAPATSIWASASAETVALVQLACVAGSVGEALATGLVVEDLEVVSEAVASAATLPAEVSVVALAAAALAEVASAPVALVAVASVAA